MQWADGVPKRRRCCANRALRELDARIKLFISLPIGSLDKMALQEKLQAIGRTPATKD